MANYYLSTTTPTATGVYAITCGFLPVAMKITVGSKTTGGDSYLHESIGQCDNTGYSVCHSVFADGSGQSTRKSTTKIVSQFERVGGAITEVNSAIFDSFTATQGKFNVNLLTSQYQYTVELWG